MFSMFLESGGEKLDLSYLTTHDKDLRILHRIKTSTLPLHPPYSPLHMAPFSHFWVFALSFAKMIFAKNFVQKRKNEKTRFFVLRLQKMD